MNTSVSIEIDPKTATALLAQAQARGQSLDAYLRDLALGEDETGSNGALSSAEFDRCLDELAADSAAFPVLPRDLGRADLKADHD